jgi:membrane peptidoglycan carboxypeptidase
MPIQVAGNNDNTPMVKQVAGYIVAPMWHEFMQVALDKFPEEFFGEPRAIPDNAPGILRGVYTDGSGIHDILHFVNKDNPLGGGNSRYDGQYPYWEYSLHNQPAALTPENAPYNNNTDPEGNPIGRQ